MSENNDLLPCPFCGATASFEEVQAGSDGVRKTVGCSTEECLAFQSVITFETKREAKAAWNRRANQAKLDAYEEMEKALLAQAMDGYSDQTWCWCRRPPRMSSAVHSTNCEMARAALSAARKARGDDGR